MKLSDKKSIQQIVATLAAQGLKEVVICPGSRNAPFIISLNRHPAFHCTSIRDERSAAFYALGKILELKEPVAIISTSGSATLNFGPAIAEAYYQRLPLVVLTADRPKAWADQGDGQTINQTHLYKNYVRAFYELDGDATEEEALWYNSRCLCEGLVKAKVKDPGPVHFNVPIKEPLYGVAEAETNIPKVFTSPDTETILSETSLQELQKIFSTTTKVMILVGQNAPDDIFLKAVKKIAAFENTIVLTESTSNIHDKDFVENIDRCITTLSPEEAAAYMPELLITIGGAVVSKRIKALMRKYRPAHHWNIHTHDAFMDTYQALTRPVFMRPEVFFNQLQIQSADIKSGFKKKWIARKQQMESLHQSYSEKAAYSDFYAFGKIFEHLPENIHVHLSNSSPIRYAQLFDNTKIASSRGNRGTSGIDGCTSTAMGAASASPEKYFLLITGDIAFHYDANALWNETGVDNLKIILINNGGGGIFRIISGPEAAPEMEEFFETSQERTALEIAAAYHWDYLSATDSGTLENSLQLFFASKKKKTILEIFTPAKTNPEVLQQYWNFLTENIKQHEQSSVETH